MRPLSFRRPPLAYEPASNGSSNVPAKPGMAEHGSAMRSACFRVPSRPVNHAQPLPIVTCTRMSRYRTRSYPISLRNQLAAVFSASAPTVT
jgi:hypothetical protein